MIKMNNNILTIAVLGAIKELREKTSNSYKNTAKEKRVQLLENAKQQVYGMILVYRNTVSQNVHIETIENEVMNYLMILDEKIMELKN